LVQQAILLPAARVWQPDPARHRPARCLLL